jgi:hypothetical protein
VAILNYIRVTQGTAIVLGPAGGAGVTHTMSLDALANGAAQQSVVIDFGATWPRRVAVYHRVETGTAPAAGTSSDVYIVSSWDGTTWAAKVGSGDGAYTLGTSDANLRQAGPPVVSLIATADANTVLGQDAVIWEPKGRYAVVICDNNLGVGYRDETTASDNGSRVVIVPLPDVSEDT